MNVEEMREAAERARRAQVAVNALTYNPKRFAFIGAGVPREVDEYAELWAAARDLCHCRRQNAHRNDCAITMLRAIMGRAEERKAR